MKLYLFIVLVLLTAAFTQAGPGPCAGCTLAVSMIEKIALNKQITLAQAGELWCSALGNKLSLIGGICSGVMGYMVPLIEPDFGHQTPDHTCKFTLKVCKEEDHKCSLYSSTKDFLDGKTPVLSETLGEEPQYKFDSSQQEFLYFFNWMSMAFTRWVEPTTEFTETDAVDVYYKLHYHFRNVSPEILKLSSFTRFDHEFETMAQAQLTAKWYHFPIFDDDKDAFSQFPKLRGSDWRGVDCDDKDGEVYPGRVDTSDKKDANCNGIHGVEPKTQRTYEELFCRNVKQYGIAVLGDSSQAHFSIPTHWLNPARVEVGLYDQILETVMNELDFPACSTVTGFDETLCPSLADAAVKPEFSSIYMRNRKRNYCANNDYQNISVNGAASNSMKPDGISTSLRRNQKADHPMIVFINLIGNDVCGKNSDPSSMTQPEEFHNDTLETLRYLETQLPAGSHVLLGTLVDGTILFNTMAHRTHFLGFKYLDFYNYLNCHYTSPCSGWMNKDENVRNATTEHAMKLSRELLRISREEQFTNFKTHYLPLHEFFAAASTVYPRPVDLIEQNDGFHPSSVAQMLLADAIWEYMEKTLKINIPVNPNNAAIRSVFNLNF